MRDYQQLTRELMICGCHVHIGISDRSTAIGVMNRARVWLAPMLALTANSPFWMGTDTGYASYRTEIWCRWPISGPPLVFSSQAEYEGLVEALVSSIVGETMQQGNGATRQRQAYKRTGRLEDVVDLIVAQTAK